MKIASKIQLLAMGLVAATAALVGPVLDWGYEALAERQQIRTLDRLVEVEARRLEAALSELSHDVALLRALPVTDSMAKRSRGLPTRLSEAEALAVLQQVFAAMAAAKPDYAQIRLIGIEDGGRERVRVDQTPAGPRVVPADELQQKGARGYFTEAIAGAADETYVSRIELNREHGVIEQPERPTLRIARAILHPDGSPYGVVIINLDFRAFVERLFTSDLGESQPAAAHYITNRDGDYLVHPDVRRTFGFERGEPARLDLDHPSLAPLFADDGPRHMQIRAGETRLAFRRVARPADSPYDRLFVGVAATALPGLDAGVAATALGLMALVMIAALIAAIYLGSRLTRPLRRITRAADVIADAGRAEGLPVDRADEIGVLARAFERMVAALGEKEQRLIDKRRRLADANTALERANLDLQHFTYIATHDLREPARRTAAIADLLLFDEAERLSEDGRQMLERLQGISENMLDRIADFRVLAGVGSGTLVRRPVALDPLLDRVLAESQPLIDGGAVTVTRGPLPRVDGYPELIELLYRNLVADAVRRADGAPCALEFGADGGILSMRAVGYTLSADALRGIFSRAARLGDGAGASGLGLTVCRRVAERHSGWIKAAAGDDHVLFTFALGGGTDERSAHPAG